MTDSVILNNKATKFIIAHIGTIISIITLLSGSAWWVISSISVLEKKVSVLQEQNIQIEKRLKSTKEDLIKLVDNNGRRIKSVWEKYGIVNDAYVNTKVDIRVIQKVIDVITEKQINLYDPNGEPLNVEEITEVKEQAKEQEREYKQQMQQIIKQDIKWPNIENGRKNVK